MPEPDERAVRRLRLTASAFGVPWAATESLADLGRRLDPHDPKQAALMLAIRRASGGADYVPFEPGVVPWHAAMAATYVHATAPLRRLADRYVVRAALAVANGDPVPAVVTEAFTRLPEVMNRADTLAGNIERAVVDLAEAVVLHGQEGRTFDAVVTDVDDRGARVQLTDLAVVGRVGAHRVQPGDRLRVRLERADPASRRIELQRVG
jgi:exoribonuclease R